MAVTFGNLITTADLHVALQAEEKERKEVRFRPLSHLNLHF